MNSFRPDRPGIRPPGGPTPGLAWLDALGPQKIRPGLSRTRRLLDSLGRPETAFASLLVAGTNGKGSTCAATAAILGAAGVRVGLYTSPHLVDVAERVRIDGRDVSRAALDDVLALLAGVAGNGALSPTYFEAMTVAAFELFRRARVSIAVVEVGIGGRLDATNVLEPEVSAVTNVGADHLETLGPTLADVAREKAGVFRRGHRAFTAATGEPLDVLVSEATRVGASLSVVRPTEVFDDVSPLAGVHQRANLALAVALARAVAPIDDATVRRGIAATRWPGRLQRLRREGRRDLLLDGAHNPDGVRALCRYLDDAGLSGSLDLVFGGLADKDLGSMLDELLPRVRCAVLVRPASPRAEDPRRLASGRRHGSLVVGDGALAALERLEGGGPGPILVCGSLVLVGEVLGVSWG